MSKELLFATLRHEETERAPWVPFAGVHAASLIGATAKQVLTDEELLFKSLLEVNRLYKPDGQPILFDLQLEAEIMGCDLRWADDNPPSVSSHPLEDDDPEDDGLTIGEDKLPAPDKGRMPLVLNTMRRMKEAVGDTTALYGLFCGPFTLASHLRGNDIFMDMFDDEDYVKELMAFCTESGKRMIDMYVDAGMDVIAVVDPLVSQISPDHFTQFMHKSFAELFDYIREKGVYSALFVCGDATKNIEVLCKTNPDSLHIDENVDLVAAKKISDQYNVVMGGNIPLTSIMLLGSQLDNMKATVDLIDAVNSKSNYIVAPGCDMPFNIPVENTIGVTQAVLETDECRKMLENYEGQEWDLDSVVIPDYEHLEKPFIEVFTLDSDTCAACAYMMGAARQAIDEFGDKIDVIEYKFNTKENIARVMKVGVKNLPSMYINGELKWSSLIPNKDELFKAIEEVL